MILLDCVTMSLATEMSDINFHICCFQAFKTLRSYIERLEKLSEDPDLREEMGMLL